MRNTESEYSLGFHRTRGYVDRHEKLILALRDGFSIDGTLFRSDAESIAIADFSPPPEELTVE